MDELHTSLPGDSAMDHSSTPEKLFFTPGGSLLLYLSELQEGVDQFLCLVGFCFLHPLEVFNRPHLARIENYWRERSTLDLFLEDAHDICGEWFTVYPKAVLRFVTLPWRSPEDYARRLYREVMRSKAAGKQQQTAYYPTPEGMVRVKWYPDLEAPLKPWPEGLGVLWTDLPIQPDGSLDLRPLMRMWGMENVYVIDANHGRRIRIGREPDEQLSAIAWRVLLNGHSVLGVVEQTLPSTRLARRARACVKRAFTEPFLLYNALTALSATVGWCAVTLLAISVFIVWNAAGVLLALSALTILAVLTAFAMPILVIVWTVGSGVLLALEAFRQMRRASRRNYRNTRKRRSRNNQNRLPPMRRLLRCAEPIRYLGSVLFPWLIFAVVSWVAFWGYLVLDLYESLMALNAERSEYPRLKPDGGTTWTSVHEDEDGDKEEDEEGIGEAEDEERDETDDGVYDEADDEE
ncbi:hypothetical protein BD414DRAFT_581559 [Trametes punicea]|nr:hypothetical protein BD414DRAFT_581559 [Trametes punicea]